jgi:hypothetical protein
MRLFFTQRKTLLVSFLLVMPTLVGWILLPNLAQAANPNLINFQGKVVNGSGASNPSTNVTDGSYTFRFCLYTTLTPATPCSSGANNDAVWRESKSLTVTNGVFQTELGDTTTMIDVSAYTNLYLGINFNGDAAGEMVPRIHLDSVPYALNSDKLGGLTSSGFIQNTTSPQSTSNFNISGTGVAGTALQAPILQTASGDLALQPATGIVSLNKSGVDNILKIYENSSNGTNFASITADHTSATFQSNSGTTKVGNGTGAITINAGTGAAVNITGHTNSVWQTDAGSLTVSAGGALSLTSGGSSDITLDSASNIVQIAASDTTLQRQASGNYTVDLKNASATTKLLVTNSGSSGLAVLSAQNGFQVNNATPTTGHYLRSDGTSFTDSALLYSDLTSYPSACSSGSAITALAASPTCTGFILNQSGVQTSSNFHVSATGAADTSFTAPLFDSQSSNGALGLGSTNAGAITIGNTGNSTVAVKVKSSTTGFAVQNTNGISLFNIDSATNNSNNIVTNPSFETSTMWTAKNGSGASAATQVSSPFYDGNDSMQVATSSTATNAGASFSATLTLNATYVLSLYVKASTTNFSTFEMGYTNTGGDNNCFTSDQTVTLSGWTRLSCSFKVTTTTGTAIYVKQTDPTGRTFFIDSVLLETDANASGYYENGQISLQGTINSPLVLQNVTNSSNAFLVQNSGGNNILGVDTTDTNLITNPGIEVNTVNWALKGSAGIVISRDTSNSYLGFAGLKVVTTAVAQDGAKFTFPNNTTVLASTQYTLSFYAKISGAGINTLSFGRSDTGVSGGETSCVTTGAITTSWSRFSCSFNTGATMGASGNPYIYISQGTTNTVQTLWIDAVSLEPGSTATPYGAGSITLNGVINSPVNFQNKSDSASAFQIQNSASLALLVVDSANKNIQIGSSTSDANAVFLVLDSYNTAADPTAPANGSMYYNTSTNVFRCRENGAWKNCIDPPNNASTADQSPSANTLTYLTGSSITIPQGGVKAGSQFIWRMSLSKTANGTAAPAFAVVFGTTGSTSDTARASFTLPIETAAVDTAQITIFCTVRSVSSTGTVSCHLLMTHNGAQCIGFITIASCTATIAPQSVDITTTSGTFDDTVANSIIGVTVNSGDTNAFTFQQVQVQTENL